MASDYDFFLSHAVDEVGDVEPHAGGSGYFSRPSQTLDPRLFHGDVLRPEVRRWILNTICRFLNHRLHGVESWLRVWLAGSGISYQWAADRGNGDLDVLLGVDYDRFFEDNPGFQGWSDSELADWLNTWLKGTLWPTTSRVRIAVSGDPVALVPPEESAATVIGGPASTLPESARNARPDTCGNTISARSTGSASKTTTGFFWNRAADARSADPTGQEGQAASTSITTTSPAGFVDSSATPATTPLASSGITKKASSESWNTSGDPDQIYSVTFYLNPNSSDIRNIHPYAAYDLPNNSWVIRPPLLPDNPETLYPKQWWDAVSREQDAARRIIGNYDTARSQAGHFTPGTPGWHNFMRTLATATDQASALFDDIHLGRKKAFGEGGQGYGDYYNFRWQAHKRAGTMQALAAIAQGRRDALTQQQQAMYGHPLLSAEQALTVASQWNRRPHV